MPILVVQQGEVVLEMHGDEELAARTQDPPELGEPRVRQVVDVREDGAGIDEAEVTVLEGQVGDGGRRDETERRAEVLLAPDDPAGVYVRAPDLTTGCQVILLARA